MVLRGGLALFVGALFVADIACASPEVIATSPAVEAQATPGVSQAMIDKAYMNCLLEVDRITDSFSKAKSKIGDYEAKSQQLICNNRKRDCAQSLDSLDCRNFIDEYALE
jgi:glycerate-2-kinase